MTGLAVVDRLHRHRAWVDGRLIEAAGGLSDEQLHRVFPIGQGSVWASLLHLYRADSLWLDAFEGRAADSAAGRADFGSLAALADAWAALDRRWIGFLESAAAASLDGRVTVADLAGNLYVVDALDGHLQLCTHAAYTAAQVVNMLRRLGVGPLPDVMLLAQSYGLGRVEAIPPGG